MPAGRPSLVCGPPGAGKSLFALQFLVNGATRYGEPGVFLTFEENRADVVADVSSLNFDLDGLEGDGRLLVDALTLEHQAVDTGEFDLEALMVRLAWAVEKIGAKRVAIDNVEALFAAFSRPALVRSELQRLFRWLKDQGLTTVITGERGEGTLTRHGIEEYLSDCVVVLDDRVIQDVATRRLRVLKYRGSNHGRNEYPFLIGADGLEVLPITSLGLNKQVSAERVSTGVPGLDEMLGGQVCSGAAVSWSAGRPAPARRRSRRASPTPPADAGRSCCSSASRSPRLRSSATWPRSGWTWLAGWSGGCCTSTVSGRPPAGWRTTWP